MTKEVLGTCSLCGGRVTLPDAWMSVNPPVPTCESCHATQKSHGPVIEMTPRPAPNTFRIGETVPAGKIVRLHGWRWFP